MGHQVGLRRGEPGPCPGPAWALSFKLEVLEALVEVKTGYPPPLAGPHHVHGDAVSSLAGLALAGPALDTPAAAAPAATARQSGAVMTAGNAGNAIGLHRGELVPAHVGARAANSGKPRSATMRRLTTWVGSTTSRRPPGPSTRERGGGG